MNVFLFWVVQLIDQNQLSDENWEHYVKLWRHGELSILKHISHNDNFVEQNEQCKVESGLLGLLLRNIEQE